MARKILAIIGMILLASHLMGCAAASARKHLNKGDELDKSGYKLEANVEYIRALKGISNRAEKGRVAEMIADNYKKAWKYDDAIKYYKLSIEYYNKAKKPAPYLKLTEVYLLQGEKGIPAAAALLNDIERIQPENALNLQLEITRQIGGRLMGAGSWSQAKHYYQEYFVKYAEKSGDEGIKEEGKQMLKTIDDNIKKMPVGTKDSQ